MESPAAAAGDQFGRAVAFSSNGTRLAIGSKRNDNQSDAHDGLVQVFEWTGITFTQVGHDLTGTAGENDRFGRDLAISADGSRLAVGAPVNDNENGEDSGLV